MIRVWGFLLSTVVVLMPLLTVVAEAAPKVGQ